MGQVLFFKLIFHEILKFYTKKIHLFVVCGFEILYWVGGEKTKIVIYVKRRVNGGTNCDSPGPRWVSNLVFKYSKTVLSWMIILPSVYFSPVLFYPSQCLPEQILSYNLYPVGSTSISRNPWNKTILKVQHQFQGIPGIKPYYRFNINSKE